MERQEKMSKQRKHESGSSRQKKEEKKVTVETGFSHGFE
jgi:hypothetical protein